MEKQRCTSSYRLPLTNVTVVLMLPFRSFRIVQLLHSAGGRKTCGQPTEKWRNSSSEKIRQITYFMDPWRHAFFSFLPTPAPHPESPNSSIAVHLYHHSLRVIFRLSIPIKVLGDNHHIIILVSCRRVSQCI